MSEQDEFPGFCPTCAYMGHAAIDCKGEGKDSCCNIWHGQAIEDYKRQVAQVATQAQLDAQRLETKHWWDEAIRLQKVAKIHEDESHWAKAEIKQMAHNLGQYEAAWKQLEKLAEEWRDVGAFMVNVDAKGCREPDSRLREILNSKADKGAKPSSTDDSAGKGI